MIVSCDYQIPKQKGRCPKQCKEIYIIRRFWSSFIKFKYKKSVCIMLFTLDFMEAAICVLIIRLNVRLENQNIYAWISYKTVTVAPPCDVKLVAYFLGEYWRLREVRYLIQRLPMIREASSRNREYPTNIWYDDWSRQTHKSDPTHWTGPAHPIQSGDLSFMLNRTYKN